MWRHHKWREYRRLGQGGGNQGGDELIPEDTRILRGEMTWMTQL